MRATSGKKCGKDTDFFQVNSLVVPTGPLSWHAKVAAAGSGQTVQISYGIGRLTANSEIRLRGFRGSERRG